MAILTIQRRLAERGRIRLGRRGEKGQPQRLDRFRLTSPDEAAIRRAAELWGGEVSPWESPAGPQWEVVIEAQSIRCLLPPELGFSQFFELWSGGGCKRRCDGETELLSGRPCICDEEDEKCCKPTTRLSLLLPDLGGVGLWRLETHGWTAASELCGVVELAEAVGGGRVMPATLRLEERRLVRDGQTMRIVVPVLDLDVDLRGMLGRSPVVPELAAPMPQALDAPAVEVPSPGSQEADTQTDAASQASELSPQPSPTTKRRTTSRRKADQTDAAAPILALTMSQARLRAKRRLVAAVGGDTDFARELWLTEGFEEIKEPETLVKEAESFAAILEQMAEDELREWRSQLLEVKR